MTRVPWNPVHLSRTRKDHTAKPATRQHHPVKYTVATPLQLHLFVESFYLHIKKSPKEFRELDQSLTKLVCNTLLEAARTLADTPGGVYKVTIHGETRGQDLRTKTQSTEEGLGNRQQRTKQNTSARHPTTRAQPIQIELRTQTYTSYYI